MVRRNNIHLSILRLVRTDILSDFPDLSEESDNKFLRRIFRNYRSNRGFFLTEFGFNYLSKKINYWSFDFSEQLFTTKHILFLERTEKHPYHFDNKHFFHTFSPKLAMTLKVAPYPDTVFRSD